MKGTVYKRAYGSGRVLWAYSIDAGHDERGVRQRIVKSGFKLEREAQEEMTRRLAEMQDTGQMKPSPKTFGAFMEEWGR